MFSKEKTTSQEVIKLNAVSGLKIMQLQLRLLGAGNVLGRTLKYKRAEENYLKAFDLDISCVILFNSVHFYYSI